jgi:hypothetical protein
MKLSEPHQLEQKRGTTMEIILIALKSHHLQKKNNERAVKEMEGKVDMGNFSCAMTCQRCIETEVVMDFKNPYSHSIINNLMNALENFQNDVRQLWNQKGIINLLL